MPFAYDLNDEFTLFISKERKYPVPHLDGKMCLYMNKRIYYIDDNKLYSYNYRKCDTQFLLDDVKYIRVISAGMLVIMSNEFVIISGGNNYKLCVAFKDATDVVYYGASTSIFKQDNKIYQRMGGKVKRILKDVDIKYICGYSSVIIVKSNNEIYKYDVYLERYKRHLEVILVDICGYDFLDYVKEDFMILCCGDIFVKIYKYERILNVEINDLSTLITYDDGVVLYSNDIRSYSSVDNIECKLDINPTKSARNV